jgi:ADP-ribose pyrophosphatase
MRIVYTGPVFSVESGIIDEPGGVRGRRDIVRHSGSVAILPVHADKRVTLVAQYRCSFRQRILELPAGRIDKGETPLQAAKRELREEIGLGAKKWERLLRILPSPGYSDETVTIFRATELFESPGTPDPDERIKPLTMPLASALNLMKLRRIQDAKTVVALLQEKRRRATSSVPSR